MWAVTDVQLPKVASDTTVKLEERDTGGGFPRRGT